MAFLKLNKTWYDRRKINQNTCGNYKTLYIIYKNKCPLTDTSMDRSLLALFVLVPPRGKSHLYVK